MLCAFAGYAASRARCGVRRVRVRIHGSLRLQLQELTARNLLSLPPRRKTSARRRASGSEGVCFHATVLHQLGIDHDCFTYRAQGLDFRLSGIASVSYSAERSCDQTASASASPAASSQAQNRNSTASARLSRRCAELVTTKLGKPVKRFAVRTLGTSSTAMARQTPKEADSWCR